MSHFIVRHNVTDIGYQEITVNDTSVKIHVSNNQIKAIAVYWIQVAAVNIIGHGPVSELFCVRLFYFLV